MSSDLTIEEQRQFANKKLNDQESTDPVTGQVTIKNVGGRKGKRKTKKSKSKKRLSLKFRKVR